MPATSTPEAEELRGDLATLTALASQDLLRVFTGVDSVRAAQAALNDLLPSLLGLYGSAASTLAADWYDDVRSRRDVRTRFRAIPAVLPDDAGAAQLVGWAYSTANAEQSVESLLLGGAERRILNQSRATITTSSLQDPAVTGWQRVGTGECRFCQMLIGRGAVYSEQSVKFASHDNCRCSAVPAFGGEPVPVKPYTVSPRRKVDPATGKLTKDADFERAKKYIAETL